MQQRRDLRRRLDLLALIAREDDAEKEERTRAWGGEDASISGRTH